MHARMHVSGRASRGGSKLSGSADSAGRKRDRPRPTMSGGLFTIVLVHCHCLADNAPRLLVAQYDSIYRVTARAQDVPATRPDDSEGSCTRAQVLGSDWQLAAGPASDRNGCCHCAFCCHELAPDLHVPCFFILFAGTGRKKNRGSTAAGRVACEASWTSDRAAHTDLGVLGRGPRLVPGLSSANGRFVFIVVDPSRLKKTARAPCPFFFPRVWLAVTGRHSLKQQP